MFSAGPGLGEVRRKDQLEEAEVGEAVDWDDFSKKLRGGKAIAWVVTPVGLSRPFIFSFKLPMSWKSVRSFLRIIGNKWYRPTRVVLIVVDNEAVAREEGELGIPTQGTADKK
jgi:hypothetical protein